MSLLMELNHIKIDENELCSDEHISSEDVTKYGEVYVPQRRFVARIIYPLFTSTFIYVITGPWIGWGYGYSTQTLILVCSIIGLFKWPIAKFILSKFIFQRKAKNWQVLIYCLIPWRFLSRSWGKIAVINCKLSPHFKICNLCLVSFQIVEKVQVPTYIHPNYVCLDPEVTTPAFLVNKDIEKSIPVPVFARPLVYGIYCKLFCVDTTEIEKTLKEYANVTDFFTRRLKVDARLIDECGLLISPCDGTVVQCGPISDKYIKKVKGLSYCIKSFLGLHLGRDDLLMPDLDNKTCLYQCVLYLAPGDYHRFHSPCDWAAFQRLHFCGKLLSVAPKVARWLPNLLAINERVVYLGKWEHGFFSYTAVGATNVGSILVHNDPTLATNKFRSNLNVNYLNFEKKHELLRGEEVGYFSMGSTIVLIFEAPNNFHFTCHENDRIKVGNCLGGLDFLSSSHNSLSSLVPEETSDADWSECDIEYEFGGSEKVLVS